MLIMWFQFRFLRLLCLLVVSVPPSNVSLFVIACIYCYTYIMKLCLGRGDVAIFQSICKSIHHIEGQLRGFWLVSCLLTFQNKRQIANKLPSPNSSPPAISKKVHSMMNTLWFGRAGWPNCESFHPTEPGLCLSVLTRHTASRQWGNVHWMGPIVTFSGLEIP